MTAIKCVIDENRILRLRPREGEWFRGLRQAAEITVAELADQVGTELALIKALENGSEPVPAALYPDFAAEFGVSLQDFAKTCLMYENPSAYEALFGSLPAELRVAA